MSQNTSSVLDPDILNCLQEVLDPEIGLSIVDLGLVYQAARTPDGIDVALTLTTRACPLGELIVGQARECLARRFQDVPRMDVKLVWEPIWNPDLITDKGLEHLGRPPRKTH